MVTNRNCTASKGQALVFPGGGPSLWPLTPEDEELSKALHFRWACSCIRVTMVRLLKMSVKDEENLGKTGPGWEMILIQGWLNDRTEGVWERAVLSFFCFSSRAQMKEITPRLANFPHSRPLSLSRLCESEGPPRANWWLQKEFIFVVVLGETGCVLFSVCPCTPLFIQPFRAASVLSCHSHGRFTSRFVSSFISTQSVSLYICERKSTGMFYSILNA